MSDQYDWLRPQSYKGSARLFAEFCTRELPKRADTDPDFDTRVYREAAELVLEELDQLLPGN